MRCAIKIYGTFLIALFIVSCEKTFPDVYDYQTPDYLDDGWETASLTSVGMDSLLIEQLVNRIYDKQAFDINVTFCWGMADGILGRDS